MKADEQRLKSRCALCDWNWFFRFVLTGWLLLYLHIKILLFLLSPPWYQHESRVPLPAPFYRNCLRKTCWNSYSLNSRCVFRHWPPLSSTNGSAFGFFTPSPHNYSLRNTWFYLVTTLQTSPGGTLVTCFIAWARCAALGAATCQWKL